MFDILFGWRKASKCKKLVKMLKCRLKLLKNKRCCIVKQLRGDVAQLLKQGHHQSAFERVEQLIMDECMVELYDLLDQFCEFLLFHLPYIRKSRDCPNDINEAVSTLIFSSARFGELPELVSIRKLFGERYGQRFITSALELRPGNVVKDQIQENLCIKKVSDDLKYKLLAEIASSCMQQGPLFLEYKPDPQQYQRPTEGQILPNAIRYRDTGGLKWTKPVDCYEMDKFTISHGEYYTCGVEIESSLESSLARLPVEMIYLDDIEEIVSPVSKDGNHQDQRLFVFKSFGTFERVDEIDINHQKLTEEKAVSRSSRKMSQQKSRRRSVSQEDRIVTDMEPVAYYGESEIFPDSQREPKNGILLQDFPLLSIKEGKIQDGLEFCERKDDREGKQIQKYGLRAMTMPAERPKECLTDNNIVRSISFPYEQHHGGYSSCRHTHPKLPDYDELAAKFKELKRANLLRNEYIS